MTGVGLGDASIFAGWRFTRAKAADVSDQIAPDHFGVLALRVMVPDAVAFADHAATAGVKMTAAPQIERLAPYGTLRTTTVTAPGGMLVEAMSTGAAPMTESELKSRFAQGGSATWVRFNNKLTGSVQWRADGTAHVVWDTGNLDEQGTWTIKGDAVCTAWTRLRFNRELCVHHFALDRNTTQSFRVDSLLPDGIYSWK